MEYLIVSTAVSDEIRFAGSPAASPLIAGGGAGLYAYSGARLWADDVGLLCGKGNDFADTLGPWFAEHGVSTAAMFPVDAKTPRTLVQYLPNGERVETPLYGDSHYQRFVAGIDQIAPYCPGCRGMYIFREADDALFWDRLLTLKGRYQFVLLWELSAASATPEKREQVLSIASRVDILSINRTEAASLFGCDEEAGPEFLAVAGIPLVFYRRGRDGALMIRSGERITVPPEKSFPVTDPTGAGNSSSGAVLAGCCQGRSPEEAGMMGSI
ncbi:MAG: carbohydrate kinase family protein, partial [Spirochaetaceae bacterium]|nr:carbohydrate kinase family protein [Spirochaetaceae bacterium]